MRVSVIIPVFNAAPFIKGCIDCLVRQTYSDFEVLFIDDHSSDGSFELIKKLLADTNLDWKASSNVVNKGTGYSRNRGIAMANGDYIFLMDQDDAVSSDCLSVLVSAADENEWPDVVMADVKASNYHYNVGFGGKIKLLRGNDSIRRAFFNNEWYEMPWNKLVRLDYIKKTNLLFPEGIFYEDTPWAFHIALTAETMVLVPKLTYVWHNGESQKTASQKTEIRINDQIISFSSMYALVNINAANNQDALMWLDQIGAGYMLSVFREKALKPLIKRNAYHRLRAECHRSEIRQIISDSGVPRGVKAMMIYRLLPEWMGYGYLHLFK